MSDWAKELIPDAPDWVHEIITEELTKRDQRIARLEAENAKLKADIQCMVEKAAQKHLPAYREQGEKMLQLTEKNERLESALKKVLYWQSSITCPASVMEQAEKALNQEGD